MPDSSSETASARFERLNRTLAADPLVQAVIDLDIEAHEPPTAIEEVFQNAALTWANYAPESFNQAELGQAFYTLMRQGWTLGQGLLEARGETLLTLGDDISFEDWVADVEALRVPWFDRPDMNFLSDEAFYCLFNVQDFGGVTTYVGRNSLEEAEDPLNRAVIHRGNLAVMFGALGVMCLSETEAF